MKKNIHYTSEKGNSGWQSRDFSSPEKLWPPAEAQGKHSGVHKAEAHTARSAQEERVSNILSKKVQAEERKSAIKVRGKGFRRRRKRPNWRQISTFWCGRRPEILEIVGEKCNCNEIRPFFVEKGMIDSYGWIGRILAVLPWKTNLRMKKVGHRVQ